MGTRDREADATSPTATDDRPRERERERDRDRDRDRERRSKHDKDKDKDKDKDGHRHHRTHSTRHSKSKHLAEADSHLSSHTHRRHRTKEERERDRERKSSSMTDLVPELARSSLTGSRVSLPYPSFSKAHSKEAVHARDDNPDHEDLPTPEPTDLSSTTRRQRSRSPTSSGSRKKKEDRPPSPPETDVSAEKRKNRRSPTKLRDEYDDSDEERSRHKPRTPGVSRTSSRRDDKSKLSMKSKTSSQATYVKSTPLRPPPGIEVVDEAMSALSDERTAGARSTSTSTSIALERSATKKSRRKPSPIEIDDSPESIQDSSPKTPTVVTPQFPPPNVFAEDKQTPASQSHDEDKEHHTPSVPDYPPPPPPPPLPSLSTSEVPRVDYLLQNGGLMHPVSKHFLSVLPRQNGSRPSNPPLAGCETLFAPFFNLLDQYQTVIQKQGSVAVATGHRSVARRLLDRLEDVFSRDLPPEGCTCIMCEREPEEHRGLGWGEVLERVGGRVEVPSWPPFDLEAVGASAIESTAEMPPRPASPVKLDPDIAEEFREHYLRQSKKVRSAVDKWMSNCSESPIPPPSEVDDETLAFAILTNLDPEEQPYFNAILSGARELQPALRAPTPMRRTRTDFLVKTGLALQRLYRLPQAPRDAETAVYLVKNPMYHDLLATITDISPQEWEILISGRFDGFLWSGADVDDAITPTAENPASRGPMSPSTGMRGASRSTTPFSGMYSRGATPASFISLSSSAATSRQPVSHDEEVEMAVLAEVEREIYQGMEALEDAFEKLHQRAEVVRNALRQRNNGLLMSQQHRRAGKIDVLPQLSGSSAGFDRPPWATGEDDGLSESDWGGDDFDLAPEDSASNISSSRHRRPKRRNERRTPAPIEEEYEG
ncbi:hypothetical protein F4809DRAFT_645461 [Biscogniauxia mediterranea]|nr:hypothetical protein F4809DRAFT_645461 [Biscogniauxia mediterranea]